MIETSNLSLTLLEGQDNFDYEIFNENFRKIDESLTKNGVVIPMGLVDETTGKIYKLYVSDGKLMMKEVVE